MALVRPTDTDEALVARTAKGDMDAYSELYKRYHAIVRAYARRRTGDMDRADELTQEIFLDAWRSAERYDPKVAPVAAWLRTITARRAVDWTRRAAVRPPLAQHEGREIVEDAHDSELVDRLDFTVVGPAVNETSRIASMCRSVDRPVLVSSTFADALPAEERARLVSVGRFALRGVGRAQDLFTIDPVLL